MKDILGKSYLTDKEASARYGFSRSWFQHRRMGAKGPKYIQLEFKGRAFYPLDETDKWFKEKMKIDE